MQDARCKMLPLSVRCFIHHPFLTGCGACALGSREEGLRSREDNLLAAYVVMGWDRMRWGWAGLGYRDTFSRGKQQASRQASNLYTSNYTLYPFVSSHRTSQSVTQHTSTSYAIFPSYLGATHTASNCFDQVTKQAKLSYVRA